MKSAGFIYAFVFVSNLNFSFCYFALYFSKLRGLHNLAFTVIDIS